ALIATQREGRLSSVQNEQASVARGLGSNEIFRSSLVCLQVPYQPRIEAIPLRAGEGDGRTATSATATATTLSTTGTARASDAGHALRNDSLWQPGAAVAVLDRHHRPGHRRHQEGG